MKETLEEAAERLQKDKYGIFIFKDADVKGQLVIDTGKAAFLLGMKEGAKWQAEQENKIDFLVWLKENRWHVYKNGKWFTTTDQPYIDGEPRKTYTEEQVIKKYKEDGKESNND